MIVFYLLGEEAISADKIENTQEIEELRVSILKYYFLLESMNYK